ncbi:MAG: hypothetical protein JST91_22990 [Actinobacteria bacterium]|nr:hypothetical protein [Actinomycetota bacterium]
MNSHRAGRGSTALAATAALIALGAVTAACGTNGSQAPATTTTTAPSATTTSTPGAIPAAPTEKSINPTAGNLFTPSVHAPAAPAVPPGQHPGINGVP